MKSNLPKINVEKTDFSNLRESLTTEWLVTNGLGGYSSCTALGINTRKYHGILVAALNPPVNRNVVLSKLDEQIIVDDEEHPIGANEFNHGIYPQGYKYLESFSRFPFPRYAYKIHDIELDKTILMASQKNAIVVSYEVSNPHNKNVTVKIFPLVSCRHFHTTMDKTQSEWTFMQETPPKKVIISRKNHEPRLVMSSSSGQYIAEDNWVKGILFRVDKSEGTSCFEDCYLPGRFELDLHASEKQIFHIMAAVGKDLHAANCVHSQLSNELKNLDGFYQNEVRRQENLVLEFEKAHPDIKRHDWLNWLIAAADSFIVRRSSTNTKTVIAGYHWFEDWGRDSLISLPGLTLVNHRFEDAREILSTFKKYCKEGIIPNRFPDKAGQQPVYNTVDATLWYFNAVLQYLKYTADFNFVQQKLWKMLEFVMDCHIQGTINGIHLDRDGLIMHGPQLTWMDATVNNEPITPREGKAVEIQALWYNALKTMELLAIHYKYDAFAKKYDDIAMKTKKSFVEKFWNPQGSYLFDVINRKAKDDSLRPNQILAASLDFSMLDKPKRTAVVSTVQEKLWTPYGLKTLSADNPQYCERYVGGWVERNYAYHNGTVWPWLTGPFVTAFLKVKSYGQKWRQLAFENFLQPLFTEQPLRSGLGTLSEIFDGDSPHSPRGCISQAWSVAEPLRAYVEDILLRRPRFEKEVLEILSGGDFK